MSYILTKEQLLYDLYNAFECAKRHKSKRDYVLNFESDLHKNLSELCNDLWNRTYKPNPSVCFVISEPKKREIFAAHFRDRIVHHLFYNYSYNLFNNTFIEDSYSCRIGKGTHYGIKRLENHIKSCSDLWKKKTYVLKMDIRGYFIHINRLKLLKISSDSLNKMRFHKIHKNANLKWDDILDFNFIQYLNEVIILNDPAINCIKKSPDEAWLGLPKSKSLFFTEENCGLPIGNLTSQLMSNVYLNVFDQYMKRVLKCKHYGRYVDDSYVVSNDKEFLKQVILKAKYFLKSELGLELHMGKTKIINVNYGIEFLGGYIKPFRTYISNKTLKRAECKLYVFNVKGTYNKNIYGMVNSYLGMFSHYDSNHVKYKLFSKIDSLKQYGYFTENMKLFKPYIKVKMGN